MTAPDCSPLNRKFADMAWLHQAGDRVLAEHHAEAAIDAHSDDDCEFHVDMAYLYAMRAHILNTGKDTP